MEITKISTPKKIPNGNDLSFGKIFSDHMFTMDYSEGIGWHSPKIIPYGPIEIDPSTMVLHYGQAVFEGLKAYKTSLGDINLFRPHKNFERMNISNERLCIPKVDVDYCVECIKELVNLDKNWVPSVNGTSLYIRPFIISTDVYLGVRPSKTYKFIILLSPVGAYYKEGINPVKIFVENNYVRAIKGGVGYVKTPGNYAASLKSQMEAQEKGYTQVLWLDGIKKKYIEEVGTMNVFFYIGDEIITPSLESGSILSGITRDSTIQLLKKWNLKVVERKISIDEVFSARKENQLKEAFGTGTAAVISPIGQLVFKDTSIEINNNKIGDLSNKLYSTFTNLQYGKIEDDMNWIVKL
ncbi:MAG: branched-chain amino acid aminotransferase [Clostridiales bacterium]